MASRPFHLAVTVNNLEKAREFYGGLLGFPEGRSDATWVDFDFYGHQFVCHLDSGPANGRRALPACNRVDGKDVPVPHFGVVLGMQEWRELAGRLKARGVRFLIEPGVRFQDKVGEQATLFFLDPFGNALEFKGFEALSQLFAK